MLDPEDMEMLSDEKDRGPGMFLSKASRPKPFRISLLPRAARVVALACLVGCFPDSERIEPASGQVRTSYAEAFKLAVSRYSAACRAGLRLDKAGAGRGPISHVQLFSRYANVFYLPVEAEKLISSSAANLLKGKLNSPSKEGAALARVCLDILESKSKLRRERLMHIEAASKSGAVFRGVLILYHYD